MTAVPWLEEPAAAWPDFLPDHLSASQLGMNCWEAYRRRYVLGEKTPPSGALIWGRADHGAHEENFGQKIVTGEDIPEGAVREAFAWQFDLEVDKVNGEVDWGEEKPGALKDAGVQLVGLYHREVSPTVVPVGVEQEFTLDVPGVPVPLVGRLDVLEANRVLERKTAKAKPSGVSRHRLQGMVYGAAFQRPVEWHYSVKTKTPAVYTAQDIPALRFEVAPNGFAARYVKSLADQLRALAETFGPDEVWPGALGHDWACSYCGFRPTCSWWQA